MGAAAVSAARALAPDAAHADVHYMMTMTTMPSRLNAGLEKLVFTMLDGLPQNFTLALNVPAVLKRTGVAYPAVPSGLQQHPRVRVFRTDDLGPITKVLPTLQRVAAAQYACVVIVIDDDVLYPAAYIADLARGMAPGTKYIKGDTSRAYYYAGRVPEGVKGYVLPSGLITPGLLQLLQRFAATKACAGADDYALGAAFGQSHIELREYVRPAHVPEIQQLAPMEPGSLAFLSLQQDADLRARYNACRTEIGPAYT